MEVKLVAYIPAPEEICAKAMRSCRAKEAMHNLNLTKPLKYYIDKALQSKHFSVLEHAVFVFSVRRISRVCTHQLVRHRIASYSQQSGRRVKPEFCIMPLSIYNSKFKDRFLKHINESFKLFEEMCKNNIPMDDARYGLPFGHESNIVITMNARELLHFFSLRLYPPAQWEITELAKRMLHEVQKVAPNIFSDFK